MARLFAAPFYTALDSNGNPISGAKLEWFLTLTSTPHDTFTDNALAVAHANPVIADAAGRFAPIYLQDADYKAVLKDAADVIIKTIDPVHGASAEDAAKLTNAQTFTKTQTWTHGATVAGATTLILGDGNAFNISTGGPVTAIATKGKGTWILLTMTGDVTFTHDPIDLILPGAVDLAAVAGDSLILEEYAVGDWRLLNYQDSANLSPLPRGYIDGLTLSNNAIDALKDIDIAPGAARDDGNAANLELTSILVKRGNAVWAVGTNQGGLDGTESVPGTPDASTWYHIWIIRRSDTGVADVLFSESATAPTMPTNYDQKRRIGAVLFDATPDILGFTQYQDDFLWDDPLLDIDLANTLTTTARLDILSVPTGIKVWAHVNIFSNDAAAPFFVYASSPDVDDEAPSQTLGPLATSGGSNDFDWTQASVLTNTSGQIRSRGSVATINEYRVATRGWTDPRGKNA